jgi:hypothetical protein
LHAATTIAPAWADLAIRRPDGTELAVRIDPDIFDKSLFRFYDLIKIAATETKAILALKKPNKDRVRLQGEPFFLWPERMKSAFGNLDVVMIDTERRLLTHNSSAPGNGQHKHKSHANDGGAAEVRRKSKKDERRRKKQGRRNR